MTPRDAGCCERWFGPAFVHLHPRLQHLHREGGVLAGPVTFRTGRGLAGTLGRAVLQRLGIGPKKRDHALTVRVDIDADGLDWRRTFDTGPEAVSRFVPCGRWPDGDWRESSGRLVLALGVEIDQGGWRWRQRACRWRGIPLPAALAPRVDGGKWIDGEDYRFDVCISLPLLGAVLAWEGRLRMAS